MTTVQGPAGLDLDAIRDRHWRIALMIPPFARNDVSDLIAEVEALRAQNAAAEARGWAKAVEALLDDGFKVAAAAIHNRECADGPSCLATPTSMTRYAGLAQECLDYALTQKTDLHGIWGGTSPKERRRLRAGRSSS